MDGQELNERLWQEILSRAGKRFETHKGATFTYQIKKDRYGETSGDLVINGKGKTITRSTVLLAFHRAMEVQKDHGCVSKPGKIGVYGDTWLYPVFLDIGICTRTTQEKARQFDQDITDVSEQYSANMPDCADQETAAASGQHSSEMPDYVDQEITAASGQHSPEMPDYVDQEITAASGQHSSDPSDDGKPGTVKTCSNCGYTTTEDFDYCPKCGRKL